MSKSIWAIVTMGFMTLIVMTFMMLFSLGKFGGTEAGNRTRLTSQLRQSFGFPEAAASVKDLHGRLYLRIEYLAHTDSKFNEEFIQAELRRVADFARERYDGGDRRSISGLRVRRLEIRGSGCWQNRIDRDLSDDTPLGPPAKAVPQDIEPPPPPEPTQENP
jgi:hypothetical protein